MGGGERFQLDRPSVRHQAPLYSETRPRFPADAPALFGLVNSPEPSSPGGAYAEPPASPRAATDRGADRHGQGRAEAIAAHASLRLRFENEATRLELESSRL